MAYIGRGTDTISNVEVLDNLTFDGSASYTLQKSSVNFVPSSANNLLISISGVVQQGNFSVSGSTITFDTTVSGSDTCDWILHYGTGLITTVADGAITEAKLGSNAVTNAKITDGTIANAKLVNSSITLNGSAVSLGGSATVGGTNTPYFHVYLGSDQSVSSMATSKVQFDTEVYDSNSDYDNSTNYRYTPTVAGKYYFYTSVVYFADANNFDFNKVSIRLNGSAIAGGEADARFGRGRQYSASCSCIQEMNGSTDYVEVFSFVASNGASSHFESTNKATFFGGYKIIE